MRRLLVCLGLVGGCFVILFAGVVVCLVLAFGGDIPKIDDSDLIPTRPVVADKDNAFIDFKKATEAFNKAPEAVKEPATTGIQCMDHFLDGEDYDPKVLTDFFTRNEAAFSAIRNGVKKISFQEPEVNSINASQPYIGQFRRVAMGLGAQSRYEHQHGHTPAAVDDASLILGFGDKIRSNPECLISYFVGVATLKIGLNEVESLVKDPRIPTAELRKMCVRMNKLKFNTEGLKRAFQKEYQISARICDNIATGKIADYTDMDARVAHMPKVYIFQRNKTKQLMADYYRSLIQQSNACVADFSPSSLPEDMEKAWQKHKISTVARPNVVGRLIAVLLLPALDRVHTKSCWLESEISGTKLMAALLLFERQKGHLPTTLDALIPSFIPAVPRDPYDGKRFRYVPEKRMVYSVGEDLTDDGGSMEWNNKSSQNSDAPASDRGDMKDAVFAF